MMKQLRSQRGDTIVEVLIALVIIGSVLTGAFAISNLSQRQIRLAQERTEAQKIAQGVTELLNGLYAEVPEITERVGGALAVADPSKSAFCKAPGVVWTVVQDTDAACQTGTENRYSISIVSTNSTDKVFLTTVKWENVLGRDEQVQIYYRVKDVDDEL